MRLLLFLRRYLLSICFIILELIAFRLIAYQPAYKDIALLSSANSLIGNFYNFTANIASFFTLIAKNERLIAENKVLKTQLLAYRQNPQIRRDTSLHLELIPAKIINNSIHLSANYLTLNKGLAAGLRPDMGIINRGVVGKIKTVSDSYSTAYSFLHPNMAVAAQVKRTKTIGVARWLTTDTYRGKLDYIPKHIEIKVGDTIITSNYNAIFPSDIPIGIIAQVKLSKQVNFQIITFEFSEEFSSLDQVYVIKSESGRGLGRDAEDKLP